MKTIIFIVVIAFAAAGPNFYTFLEDVDLYRILDNDQKLEDFVDCVVSKGPCTELYDSYKDLFSAAVKEKCQKCTPHQRHLFWLFLEAVKTKSPENYISFRIKYDPEDIYFEDLMVQLQHKGIAF